MHGTQDGKPPAPGRRPTTIGNRFVDPDGTTNAGVEGDLRPKTLGLLKVRKSSGFKQKGVHASPDRRYHIPYGSALITLVPTRREKDARHLLDEKAPARHDPWSYSVLTHAIPCRYAMCH
ncbi:MAG TPA: hypothetical protein PK468_19795 [Candidatus Hydrogenedentes bacterium]|mgnify:CR=1 FL=1|nr:hypothetical protein [Candidatus Hydrogenedentota bacterium]